MQVWNQRYPNIKFMGDPPGDKTKGLSACRRYLRTAESKKSREVQGKPWKLSIFGGKGSEESKQRKMRRKQNQGRVMT